MGFHCHLSDIVPLIGVPILMVTTLAVVTAAISPSELSKTHDTKVRGGKYMGTSESPPPVLQPQTNLRAQMPPIKRLITEVLIRDYGVKSEDEIAWIVVENSDCDYSIFNLKAPLKGQIIRNEDWAEEVELTIVSFFQRDPPDDLKIALTASAFYSPRDQTGRESNVEPAFADDLEYFNARLLEKLCEEVFGSTTEMPR